MPQSSKPLLFIVRTAFMGLRAPSRKLIKSGFQIPPMVTTAAVRLRGRHRRISRAQFADELQAGNVLAHEKDYGGLHGLLKTDLQECLDHTNQGALLVGSPNFAAQLKKNRPETLVAVLRTRGADVSYFLDDLEDVNHHVVEVDSVVIGESQRIHDELLGLLKNG